MARPLGRIAGTRIGNDATGPRLDGFYRWRDPARVGPQRRAQLEAHDRQYADPGLLSPSVARGQELRARAAQRRAEFTRLRAAGHTIEAAAEAVGWCAKTGQRYERETRREAADA